MIRHALASTCKGGTNQPLGAPQPINHGTPGTVSHSAPLTFDTILVLTRPQVRVLARSVCGLLQPGNLCGIIPAMDYLQCRDSSLCSFKNLCLRWAPNIQIRTAETKV
ncbi:hypothetical protein VFPPC_18473 [Pochonia chlamydosporia 170]|uniref:Uncharacterized protein n=1 Tax=Pochonia chlamydosporia 170 TaxID=1380566 RepID=A0A219ANR5_METCM|nr:hypothetical protein VFPPC_18473 [Pochonia chlamydosporia 170]OWT42393.1 hypothetical protein VFPPC_18473 [Pochonia chlamydosporia 170]